MFLNVKLQELKYNFGVLGFSRIFRIILLKKNSWNMSMEL
jgi:hypothetical protein